MAAADVAWSSSIVPATLSIRIGSPDRVLWDGRAVSRDTVLHAIRWRGLDLQTEHAGEGMQLRGRIFRVQMMIPDGRYDVELTTFGTDSLLGPFDVLSNGRLVFNDVAPRLGKAETRRAGIDAGPGPMELFFRPRLGRGAGVVSLRLFPHDPRVARTPLGTLPSIRVDPPRPDSSRFSLAWDPNDSTAQQEAEVRLRSVCEYFLMHQLGNGFFDYESSSWWEAGLVARCLLAGHSTFGEQHYLAAARRLLDFLVLRQAPDGGWCSYAFNVRTGAGSEPDAPQPPGCNTRNVADLSVAATALSLLARNLPPEDAAPYLDAHRRFIDEFASRYSRPDGSWSNGLFQGAIVDRSYSVATATAATSLVSLYRATGQDVYLHRAEEAARFLADTWQEDGVPVFRGHTDDPPAEVSATDFHNLYYLLEGLLWVRRATRDEALRSELDRTLSNYVLGERGLLASLKSGGLPLPYDENRDLAKICGMVSVFFAIADLFPDEPRFEALLRDGRAELLEPARAASRRILAFPYDEFGKKALVITAFAGLSYAEMARPGSGFR